MSTALTILKDLQQRASWPTTGTVLSQAVTPDQRWAAVQAQLAAGSTAAVQLGQLLASYGSGLSRQDIIGFPQTEMTGVDVLLASLIWGYGTSGLRWPDRPGQLVAMLDDHGLPDRLNRASAAVATGDFDASLAALVGHKGIGVPYLTKFLYFEGRRQGVDVYPLILDTKVALGLSGLTGHRFLVRLSGHRPVNAQDYYGRFCRAVHQWAAALGVCAEEIEYVLWKQTDPFWQVCEQEHDAALP